MVTALNDPPPRRSLRSTRSNPSGSEYSGGSSSPSNVDHMDNDNRNDEQEEEQHITSSRGRKVTVRSYKEDTSDLDDDLDDGQPKKSRGGRHLNGFIVSDDSGGEASRYNTRARAKSVPVVPKVRPPPRERRPLASKRTTRRNARTRHEEDGYEEGIDEEADADGSIDEDIDPDAPHTSPSPEPEVEEDSTKTYKLRKRAPVNYAIPPPLEDLSHLGNGRSRGDRPKGKNKPPRWGATGAELSRMMGLPIPGSDSDSDGPAKTPRKTLGAGGIGGGMFANGSAAGVMPEFGVGTPSNLGKVAEATLADADPLGVNQNVTFDSVGGLDDHISALKEMTLLPLLYPELFQRFNLTPPRGVLFHGPPGTGKTLLARALASSCRSGGRSISFFMRKGADVLSKWVGEAERQLRILFEEAKACQPSIIFFDEIDGTFMFQTLGLAPVRSSRQDQIHASIVATLLALMDGMDGRGQVVVIGATNRPDAVDPALRRPGRFDREFYFPLPNLTARSKILGILTKDWDGWDGEKGEKARAGLAKLTKGYGGADLRALCTEAALNAVQRQYPQIYQSEERLLVKPETVQVQPRDFMISIKKLVPSSARSTSSVANPLPPQLVPLLSESLHKVQSALNKAIPPPKKRNALEEAEWEEDGDDDTALQRETLLQSLDILRIYRPRIVLYGPPGMGQGYVGAAALHHLEGFHLQSLDLGNLHSDSSRTTESAIVHLFIEAKRNQPSVIYIPSLAGWCAAVSESARATVQSMLDSLAPTDPILLLAVADCPLSSLPRDVRAWFGLLGENRVVFEPPTREQRSMFFQDLIKSVQQPPSEFPDAVKRRRRILEKLPIAPPIAPRAPTAAELAQQEQKDEQTVTMLKFRLGHVLMELKKKFKRFSKSAADEYGIDGITGEIGAFQYPVVAPTADVAPSIPVTIEVNGIATADATLSEPLNGLTNGIVDMEVTTTPAITRPQMYKIDLERIQKHLYRSRYLTVQDFLDDVAKIVHNATVFNDDNDRLVKAQMMYTTAQVHTNEFDSQFRLECERMAVRERKRREKYAAARPKPIQHPGTVNGTLSPTGGIRRSARNNGQEPDVPITDPVKLERRLKRQRSSEPSVSPDEKALDDAPVAKKAKTVSDVDEVPRSGSPHIENAVTTQPEHSMSCETNVPDAIPADAPVEMLEPVEQVEPMDIVEPEVPPLHPRSPSPEPPPPFTLSEQHLQMLSDNLVELTSELNVEQLEQLRAACLGCVWRRRSDWDRDDMVSDLLAIVKLFVEEVRDGQGD
ncbi:AAA-domain-containing protein [Hysterangium stoloniferum]|nr:AAA-domain-containing protein [Hysterangium stoloniferum]